MIREGIQQLIAGKDLAYQDAEEIMREIMSGATTEAQISAFLTALRIKGETIEEISAFAAVMREFCYRIRPQVNGRLLDTCGTGGDQIKTFNISTTAAFVIAGTGVAVAKHGNRSVTSNCGSADVLESLGLNLDLEPQSVERIIEKIGIGFMYAPKFHPAMKYAIGPRRQIGIRTVFNILGPLTNPANANAQIVGVYDDTWLTPLAQVLKQLGCEEAMVVHGSDGLDELSIIGKTSIAWLKDGQVSSVEKTPRDFGFKTAKPEEIRGASPEESAVLTFKLLNSLLTPEDPRRNIVLMNAAAGILVSGKAETFEQGIALGEDAITSGAAYTKLTTMIKASKGDLSKLEELESCYA